MSLYEFRLRTESFNRDSLPHNGNLVTNINLKNKVDLTGKIIPFIGNTVVFALTDDVKEKVCFIQNNLYKDCSAVLAEPLTKNSFHITLHDLLSGSPSSELEQKIKSIQSYSLDCVEKIADKNELIHIQSTTLFNMVNTSIVLGFEPVDENSYQKLINYYDIFQSVVNLNYSLTPHITVAYFKPINIDVQYINKFQKIIDYVNSMEKISIELSGKMLKYQTFSDMNHYYSIK